MEIKICSKCEIEKSLTEFYRDKTKIDGLYSSCKNCTRIYKKNNANYIKLKRKEYYESHKEIELSNGKKYKKGWYLRNKKRLNQKSKKYYDDNKINLLKIQMEKYYANPEYYKIKRTNYYHNNKEKILSRKKKYQEKHKERKKQYAKEYYQNNKKEIQEKRKIYYQNNKKEVIQKWKVYKQKKMQQDPIYYINELLHTLFRTYLKTKNIIKKNCFYYYAKQTKENYFEQFQQDPLWEKYIKNKKLYQIDHIIPRSSYNFLNNSDIEKCWNPKNLRILLTQENKSKSNKIDIELIKQHKIEHLLPEGFKL
jgi:hypothetical protein